MVGRLQAKSLQDNANRMEEFCLARVSFGCNLKSRIDEFRSFAMDSNDDFVFAQLLSSVAKSSSLALLAQVALSAYILQADHLRCRSLSLLHKDRKSLDVTIRIYGRKSHLPAGHPITQQIQHNIIHVMIDVLNQLYKMHGPDKVKGKGHADDDGNDHGHGDRNNDDGEGDGGSHVRCQP